MSSFHRLEFYIDRQWVCPVSEMTRDVENPATRQLVAQIALGNAKDTDRAVQAAKTAFPSWSTTSAKERIALFQRLHQAYATHRLRLAKAISTEMGAPIDLAVVAQTAGAESLINEMIELLSIYDFAMPNGPNETLFRVPVGVCALITPWSWPMDQTALKVLPALAAGCTIVLKPSEMSPLSAIVFAEMIDEAGFPLGVFNLVNGDGVGVGKDLCSHPDVDLISFTGSTRAGKAITVAAASTVKRVLLELGGKGGNIVFADADTDAVARGVKQLFSNSGQSCNAPSRMFVERAIYQDAVEIARKVAQETLVDDPEKPGSHLGPVVNETQFTQIQKLIEQGIAEGARLIAGGLGRPEGLGDGYFVKPTVFADASNDMTIAREEIFGPVITMIPFDTEEEVIDMVNDTIYGLSNYVQTQDKAKAARVAAQLRSGMVRINGVSPTRASPFGGCRQSGHGREGGIWGFEEFLDIKSVTGL